MALDLLNQLEVNLGSKRVDIIEFAQSSRFCNRVLYPRQRLLLKLFFLQELTENEERILDHWIAGGRNGEEISISPFIRERIQWLRENGYEHFREITLVGGRRCSKGFITGLSVAKKIYDTVQLQDPAKYYGIDAGREIIFACIAAAQDQAKDQQYADVSAMVNSCGFLQPYINKMQELEFSVYTETDLRNLTKWRGQGRRVMKDTAKIRGKALPANARTIRGSATMVYVFDEFAHFMQGDSDQSDSEVYAAAVPSVAQFNRAAMIFNNSSPYSKVGTFYDRYEAGMATEDAGPADPTVLSVRFPSWALFEGWWEDPTYIGPKKCITVSPDWDIDRTHPDGTFFYTDNDRAAIGTARREEIDNPNKFKVERRGNFAEVIDAYLNPDMVDRMFRGRPVGQEFNEEEDTFTTTYKTLRTNYDDSHYYHDYYAHLDPSSTTAGFGFALGHVEDFTFNGRSEKHVIFDIIKRWNPKDFRDNTIEWDPILEEVLYLANIFRPRQITMDQHQSAHPIQFLTKTLRERGMGEVRVFEKTANSQGNWNRAEVFKTAINHNLVHAPYDTADCQYASLELKFLQEIKSARIPRVEKQEVGDIQTKDIADCMMEVVEACIGNLIATGTREELGEMGIRGGAPGGYAIGGGQQGSSGRASELASYYSRRHGEQRFGNGGNRDVPKGNPARRLVGGRPIQRKLPGR